MGCDIHVMVEAKTASGWHLVHLPQVDRWYALFARMADIRNYRGDIEPIAEPRGVPEDCDEVTAFLYADNDYHSHSWLSSTEWESIVRDERFGGIRGSLSDLVPWRISDRSCRDERILDYRLVFAFDN